jgi:hypothetical protein
MPGRSSFVKTRGADTPQTAGNGRILSTIDLNFLQFRYIVGGNGPAWTATASCCPGAFFGEYIRRLGLPQVLR